MIIPRSERNWDALRALRVNEAPRLFAGRDLHFRSDDEDSDMSSLLSLRHLGALTVASLALSFATGVPSSAVTATHRAATPMCLDVGKTRNNNDGVKIWKCAEHPNQRFVISDGHIKVEDTIGTGHEKCLDAGKTRHNGDKPKLWSCANHPNQKWIVRGGQIVIADTVGHADEMCLDAGKTRHNGDMPKLWKCADHPNQKWALQRGQIRVADTI